MSWERMTVDEYASFEKAAGTKVKKIDGIWWVESPPFFFRPLFPFTELSPNKFRYPNKSRLMGFKHPVPPSSPSNSFVNSLVYNELDTYSLEHMDSLRRRQIRIGLNNFSIKPIENLNEFINDGHKVYLSFYERTKYPYKKDRVKKGHFAAWAAGVFHFPKIILDGAYYRGELSGINISYLVEDVIFNATFFSTNEALKLQVSDAVLHIVRERARLANKVKFIYEGALSGNQGHDEFKIRRGGKVLRQPALYRLNPLVLIFLKFFDQSRYKKINGYLDESTLKKIPLEKVISTPGS